MNNFIESIFSNIININHSKINNFDISNIPHLIKLEYYNNKFILKTKSSFKLDETRINIILSYFNSLTIKTYPNPIYIIINIADGNLYNLDIPIFSYNKIKNTNNILIFNHCFLLYKKIFEKINNIATYDIKLEEKEKKIIFIGNNSNKDRYNLCHKYLHNKDVFAKLINYEQDINHELYTSFLDINEQLKFRYNICIDGNGTAFDRFPWQLMSNSLVLKIKSNNDLIEWFYPFIDNCYIECDIDNILDKKKYFDDNLNEIHQINKNAQSFVSTYLNKNFMDIFTKNIIEYYSDIYNNSYKDVLFNLNIDNICIKPNLVNKDINVIFNETNYPIYGQKKLYKILYKDTKLEYNIEFSGQPKIKLNKNTNIAFIIQAEGKNGYKDMEKIISLNPNKKIIYLGNMFSDKIENYNYINYTHFWIPFCSIVFTQMNIYTPSDLLDRNYNCNNRKLCCYMASREVYFRENIWDKICEYCINNNLILPDAYGKCNGYKNLGNRYNYPMKDINKPNYTRFDLTVELYKNYKFVFVSENTRNNHGYITEKIICAYLAGAIPIYCGSSNIFSIFNKNTLLYINSNMDNINEVLLQIKTLDSDITLYNNFVSQEIISKDKFNKFFMYKDLLKYLDNLNYKIM